jgi:hypothetical protein
MTEFIFCFQILKRGPGFKNKAREYIPGLRKKLSSCYQKLITVLNEPIANVACLSQVPAPKSKLPDKLL